VGLNEHTNLTKQSRGLLLSALIPAVLFCGLFYALFHQPFPWAWECTWVPSLDIDLALRVDGLSAQFLLLITGIGTLVFIYGAGYLAGHPKRKRVYVLLLLFMLAMIGAVVSDNLFLLFIFWELTSVLSFLLVGFDHEQESSRKSAQQAILVTGAGGLFLLAGIILLGQAAETYSIHLLLKNAPSLMNDGRLAAALALIFVGCFTKSAQFPFHFWLPNAMAAPTPVSAYLHSATMVKLGIYLLARLDAAFSDFLFWEYSLVSVGTLTAVLAAIQTFYERDLKRILAWSTIATLGTLVMLVGLPGNGAALATSALIFAHALYKAPLFFVVGNLDHGAGTRELDKLTGMRRYMPWTAYAALFAALSMAGLPLTFGFVSKDTIVFAKTQADVLHLVSYATVFVNAVSVAVAAIAAVRVFWGRDVIERRIIPHEASLSMLLPPLLLVALGLLFGIKPALVDPVLCASAHAMAPGFDAATLETSYDLLPVLEAMLVSVGFGVLLYWRWDWFRTILTRIRAFEKFGPEALYRRAIDTLPRLASIHTRLLQHGMLPRYLMTLVGAVTVIILTLLILSGPAWTLPSVDGLTMPVLGAAMIISAGAITALFVRDRLVLLLVSGLVGYGSAILFLFSGAPDLAFTQLVVETVFVVVAAAVLLRLRRAMTMNSEAETEPLLRPVPLLIAVAFSASLTVLLLLASGHPFDSFLTDFYNIQSLAVAHGRNVVNIILVDFRAFDTLGEIAVLTFALWAALPLLNKIRERRK